MGGIVVIPTSQEFRFSPTDPGKLIHVRDPNRDWFTLFQEHSGFAVRDFLRSLSLSLNIYMYITKGK